MIKGLILDLDNTIYPVVQIGENLFKPLFDLILEHGGYKGEVSDIRFDTMRMPFQHIISRYEFSSDLARESIDLLTDLAYHFPMEPFDDYEFVRGVDLPKFLVTTGFSIMQNSKVDRLGIRDDFEEIHIVDPATSDLTKKDIFSGILERYQWQAGEVLVIGDDVNSEIKAGNALGIPTVLYLKAGVSGEGEAMYRIADFGELGAVIS